MAAQGLRVRIRRWCLGVLLLTLLTFLGNASAGPEASPSSAPVAPNASQVTAEVLKYSIWNAKLLGVEQPITLYSLVLDVLTSDPVRPGLLNLVRPGDRIEAFSKEELSPELFGRLIEAIVHLTGDERGQRFWISGIKVLESESKQESEG